MVYSKFTQMRIDLITCVPALVESPLNHSIMKRAQDKGLLEVVVHNLRDYATDKYKSVDDYQYGGGAGMVLMIEPIAQCIDQLKDKRSYDEVIYMTPDGDTLNQQVANQLSLGENIIILAGHYKGVDHRVREHLINREISVGDFVVSGGELPAVLLIDAIGRLIPGVLSDETSALTDSFQDHLLAPPVYTRPAEYKGWRVPEILMSGHEAKIEEWRTEKAIERTKKLRPDLFSKNS